MSQQRLQVPRVGLPVSPPAEVRSMARSRFRLTSALLTGLLIVVGLRGVTLCLHPQEKTLRAASIQRWDQVTLRGQRGEVLDRNGRRLATSVITPNIVVDPALIEPEDVDSLVQQVAEVLDLNPLDVAAKMKRDSRYARLAMRVHPSVVAKIKSLNHRALWAERDSRRYYPEGMLASQLLGFVDGSGIGREGLEASFNNYLRGSSVLLQRRRDRRGLDVDGPVGAGARVNQGMTVHTTIDRTLQHIAERALAGVVEKHEPKSASAIVVDVTTGDILVLANAPAFNPNNVGSDPAPRRNHIVQDAVEPGSVFKPFTLAAAIEEGLVFQNTIVDCEGGAWYVGRSRIRDDHPHRLITVKEVMKYSSNICSAKLAMQLGPETFLRYIDDFGFGQTTGIPLPGERRGVVRDADKIKPIELATTSFGQGTTTTMLQLAMGIAAIANNGVRMRPRLVTEVLDVHGVPEVVQRPEAVKRVLSAKTAATIADMMVSV
ncbi:MAG: penicillin-binding protein 2, partial [Proteobacteria bacterium]|nr:penicillin-binding protein 2 [Pseudomonadota bacterium]